MKAIWEWIKTLFLGVRLINTKQLQEFINELNDRGIKLIDALDLDKDGKISVSELIKAIKKYMKK